MVIGVNARFLLKGKLEGIGLYTHEVLKRMVVAHPEDTFVFFFDRAYDPSFLYASNVKGVVVSPPARHPVLWYWWFEKSLPKAIKRHGVDVFFSPDGYTSLSSPVPDLQIVHDLAYLHYPAHVPFLVRKYYEHYIPKYLAKSTKIGCVSDATRKDILRHFPVSEEKLFIAYNGCRSEFRPLDERSVSLVRERYSGGKPYFLFVGALHPRKNVARMLEAYEHYRMQGGKINRLIFVGRKAWMTGPLEQVFDRMGYRDEVIFTGYLQLKALAEITGAAFALLYMSLFEGFGVPILEAMHCDIPIITSDVSSMPEVSGNAALHVRPTDVPAISDAMRRLEVDSALRLALVEAGKKQRERFDWEATAKSIYEGLVSCQT